MLCSNSEIIKYSLENLIEVGRYTVDFEVSNSSEIYFIDESTIAVRKYSGSDVLVLVDCDDMELKAEVDGFVYSMNEDRKLICRFYNGTGYSLGYYKHRNESELIELAKEFLKLY